MATKNAVTKAKPTGGALVNWQQRLTQIATQAIEQEASVATGNFLNFKGGQMSFQGAPIQGNKLDVVVVDAILENAYYENKYDPDEPQPPSCYAFGRNDKELRPHPEASDPQSETCATCRWNRFGTAENEKSKACKNIRRLALVPADMVRRGPEATMKAEIAFAKIPVTSVKGWAAYVRTLAATEKRPPIGVVTKMSTIPDPVSQFKVLFEHVENVPDKVMGALMAKYDEVQESIMAPYPKPEPETARRSRPAKKSARRGKY